MLTDTTILGIFGLLAGLTTCIVEVLKQLLPDSVPTKVVTIIVAFIVTILYTLVSAPITPVVIVYSIAESFLVAYIAMFGFDSLKDIFSRFKNKKIEDKGDEE